MTRTRRPRKHAKWLGIIGTKRCGSEIFYYLLTSLVNIKVYDDDGDGIGGWFPYV